MNDDRRQARLTIEVIFSFLDERMYAETVTEIMDRANELAVADLIKVERLKGDGEWTEV